MNTRLSSYLKKINKKIDIKLESLIKFKTLYVIIFCFLIGNSSYAQEASTSVNIVLADVLSIDPESAVYNGTVEFQYENVTDYNSEKIRTVPKSLIITFSKPFDVKVKANGEYFTNGNNLIPIDVLTIRRNPSSTIGGTSAPIILSTSNQVLVGGVALGSQLRLDLDYIIPAAKASSDDILGKPSGNYTQTIVFSATAF